MLLLQKLVRNGEESTSAASTKALGQFPQTGHSPRNDANQPANDCIADKAAVRATVLNGISSAIRKFRCLAADGTANFLYS